MTEILQAEIVAYSSPKEIFVNAQSGASSILPVASGYKLIDMSGKTLNGLLDKAFRGIKLWKS